MGSTKRERRPRTEAQMMADCSAEQPHQLSLPSSELENSAIQSITASCASPHTDSKQTAAMQAIAYALLALLQFLRETEAKEQGCRCDVP